MSYRLSEGDTGMGYGHAERNLALIRQLEAQTRDLLETLDQPDPEQSAWLQEVISPERPGDGLDDAVQQLQRAAAPLLRLLSPKVRDSIQHIGWAAEE
jgi:hypothetical protein